MVWKYTILAPRVIETMTSREGKWTVYNPRAKKAPSTLQACRESRDIALKTYNRLPFGPWFNFDRDILYIHLPVFLPNKIDNSFSEFPHSKVRYVACALNSWLLIARSPGPASIPMLDTPHLIYVSHDDDFGLLGNCIFSGGEPVLREVGSGRTKGETMLIRGCERTVEHARLLTRLLVRGVDSEDLDLTNRAQRLAHRLMTGDLEIINCKVKRLEVASHSGQRNLQRLTQ